MSNAHNYLGSLSIGLFMVGINWRDKLEYEWWDLNSGALVLSWTTSRDWGRI